MDDTRFICPKCCGTYFGSASVIRDDGSVWKTAEHCHDEFGVGCNERIAIEPVMICGPGYTTHRIRMSDGTRRDGS